MFIKKFIVFLIFFIITILCVLASLYNENEYLEKMLYTCGTLSILYLFFKIVLEVFVAKKIQDSRSRYSFRKTMHILFIIVFCIALLRIWVVDPQALMVAYGLVAAGVAIALQDLFKNFAGGIVILLTRPYHVGHRIEINGTHGDVIDISIMYTTLLEMREWVGGDQSTGRIITVPNGVILSQNVDNYTKDHSFIWDEFMVPITYDSNWKEAMHIIKQVLVEETDQYVEDAKKNFLRLEEKYYVSSRNMEANVYISLTDNWIQMNARYVVEARDRRITQAAIMEKILIRLEECTDIYIASTTLSVTDAPNNKILQRQ